MMNTGDMRAYRSPIRLEISTEDEARLRGKTWSVRDSSGTVGELRHVYTYADGFDTTTGDRKSTTVGMLSTDRSSYNQSYDANIKFSVTFGEDNNISLKPVAPPAPQLGNTNLATYLESMRNTPWAASYEMERQFWVARSERRGQRASKGVASIDTE